MNYSLMADSITDSIHQPDDMEMIDIPEGKELFDALPDKVQNELLMDQMCEPYGNGKDYLGQLSWLHAIGADLSDFMDEAKAASVDNEYAVEKWWETQ